MGRLSYDPIIVPFIFIYIRLKLAGSELSFLEQPVCSLEPANPDDPATLG
jgi:hypothetical protein